jgi:hypothetical protein
VWVKGHQDRSGSTEILTHESRLKFQADFLTTQHCLRGKVTSSQNADHQQRSQRVSMSNNGQQITSQYDKCIRYHINGYHLRQYLQRRRQWSDIVWESIDFDLCGKHYRRLSFSRQIQHMKLHLPLGKRRHQISQSKDWALAMCPCCGQADETAGHLTRCQSNEAHKEGRRKLLRDRSESAPHLMRWLMFDGISNWQATGSSLFSPSLHVYPPHMKYQVVKVASSQSAIGWDNALKNFVSND